MATLEATSRISWLTRRADGPRADPLKVAALLVIGAIATFAVIGPFIGRYEPSVVDILSANQGPSADHWLGTDSLGRDVFARLASGATQTLVAAAVTTAIATLAGTVLAVAAAWKGGRFDRSVARVLDVAFAFPGLLFAIIAVAVLGAGVVAPILALSIAYTPYIARLLRSVTLRQRHLPYVESCQLLGYSAWRTTTRHLLPSIRPFIVAQATLTFGYSLLDLAAISFIGLGVQPPNAEWGLMVSNGASALINGYPWEVLFSGLAIVVTVVAFNVLGERLAARAEETS